MNPAPTHEIRGCSLICALAACILSVVLLGGISRISVQAAQRAALQQS